MLGFNTVMPDHWGALPVKVLNDVLSQHGLRARTIPALWPGPREFPFDFNVEDVEAFARAMAAGVLATDLYIERLSDVADIT
ncbi:hypothetical protein [Sorangium sp. So ce861]|uniref:hypothetical protein n=1 Tax=Sorangium sp. So ce861 TaxID=3133323 RepID=UPI003F5E1952